MMTSLSKLHKVACGLAVVALIAGLVAPAALAEDVRDFPTVNRTSVNFWSDGTRLAGDVFKPKDMSDGDTLPAIVLCHGWGGTKAHLNRQIAPGFAAAGYVVLAFDYRGWGESNSRLILKGKMPKPDDDGNITVTVTAVQQIVDPLDQQEDIDAAITFMEGEPGVDANRIGIWGSSFGGGHVVWRAAHDPRVKCVAAQVGGMDSRAGLLDQLKELREEKIKRVRGDLAPVPLDADMPEGLTGTPYYIRFLEFSPVSHADKITAPTIIIDAENEHYFDNKENGHMVYSKLKGRVPVEYHLFEGIGHYDIYSGESLKKAMKLEIAWFDKHLKG